VPGQPDHAVACLLPGDTRKRMWSELRAGKQPDDVRKLVELEERPV
jgi:hypothetical protein